MISELFRVPREASFSMNEVSKLISLPLASVTLPSRVLAEAVNSRTDKGRMIALS